MQLIGDYRKKAVRILHDVVIPEAQDAIAFGFDQPGSVSIVSVTMLATVSLDDELCAMRHKVGME